LGPSRAALRSDVLALLWNQGQASKVPRGLNAVLSVHPAETRFRPGYDETLARIHSSVKRVAPRLISQAIHLVGGERGQSDFQHHRRSILDLFHNVA